MSDMVLVGSIRIVLLCDLSMNEVCWVSDTMLPSSRNFCTYRFLRCCIANGQVHSSLANDKSGLQQIQPYAPVLLQLAFPEAFGFSDCPCSP